MHDTCRKTTSNILKVKATWKGKNTSYKLAKTNISIIYDYLIRVYKQNSAKRRQYIYNTNSLFGRCSSYILAAS